MDVMKGEAEGASEAGGDLARFRSLEAASVVLAWPSSSWRKIDQTMLSTTNRAVQDKRGTGTADSFHGSSSMVTNSNNPVNIAYRAGRRFLCRSFR